MNRRQRFLAAVRGEELDRVPVTAWCNLATDGVDGVENARRQLAWFEAGGWDICKAMNDYRLAPPEGVETLHAPNDLLRFTRRALSERAFAEQMACLRCMRDALPDDVPLLDTLFEPFFSVLFAVGFSKAAFMRAHRAEASIMLEALTEAYLEYIAEIRKVPVDGVLYATNACILPPSSRGISTEEFRAFHEPYDLRLLAAMDGIVRVVHAHGNPLDIGRILHYPFEVLNWSDRLPGNPSIEQMRRMTRKCLMGGIDESRLHERSLPEIRAEVADALAQSGGTRKLILSPGCNVNSGISTRHLLCLRDTARGVAS